MSRNRTVAALCRALAAGPACTPENNINIRPINAIAVVSGDFDHMGQTLDRLPQHYTTYEGFICCASYDPEINPDSNGLKEETLFTGTVDGGTGLELNLYDAVFLNSGARGWGEWEYNGIEPDDDLLTNQEALDNIAQFVDRGGRLVLSDWAYDLIPAIWPGMIDFYGDEAQYDAAQVGAIGDISATVSDAGLAQLLDTEVVSLAYNYSNWGVIESVSDEVDVLLSGDVDYRASASEGIETMSDVPLFVSFESGAGLVVYSTFHWNAQTPALAEELMLEAVDGLDRGFTGEAE